MAQVMYVVSRVQYSDETTVTESTPIAVSDSHTKARTYANYLADMYARDVGEVYERKLEHSRNREFYVLKPDPQSKTEAWVVRVVDVLE